MTTPLETPNTSVGCPQASLKQRRAMRLLLGVVAASVILTAFGALRNWGELTLAHHLVGIALWVVLPFLALVLVYQRRAAGRWILLTLFASHGIIELYVLAELASVTSLAFLLQTVPGFRRMMEGLFYWLSAGWLLCSPGIRQLFQKGALWGQSLKRSALGERSGVRGSDLESELEE